MISLTRQIFQQMLDHALNGHPLEACGLVSGKAGRAARFHPTENAAKSPVWFTIPPQELLRVVRELDGQELDLLAIFHSHPASRAYPSAADIAQALYPDSVYLILSLADRLKPDLRGYWIREGKVEEVAVEIEDQPPTR